MSRKYTAKPLPSEIKFAERGNPIPGFNIASYLRRLNFGHRYVPPMNPRSDDFNMNNAFAFGMIRDRFPEARP